MEDVLCERQMSVYRIGGILPQGCGKMPQIQWGYSHLPLALRLERQRCDDFAADH
jgi:hypothetical protein